MDEFWYCLVNCKRGENVASHPEDGINESAKWRSQYPFISETNSDIPFIDYQSKSAPSMGTCKTLICGRSPYFPHNLWPKWSI